MHDKTPPIIQPVDPSLLGPGNLHPGNAEWWWQYGLDGLVGGVVGGVFTGLAVVLTIRHERRLAEQTSLSDAVGRLQISAYQAGFTLPDADDFVHWRAWLVNLQADSLHVAAISKASSPKLSQMLSRFWDELAAATSSKQTFEPDRRRLSALAVALSARLGDWQSDLGKFKSTTYTDWSEVGVTQAPASTAEPTA